jgi:hypothetical protein
MMGIPVAWEPKGERAPDGGRADHEVRTVLDLAEWLAPGVAPAA